MNYSKTFIFAMSMLVTCGVIAIAPDVIDAAQVEQQNSIQPLVIDADIIIPDISKCTYSVKVSTSSGDILEERECAPYTKIALFLALRQWTGIINHASFEEAFSAPEKVWFNVGDRTIGSIDTENKRVVTNIPSGPSRAPLLNGHSVNLTFEQFDALRRNKELNELVEAPVIIWKRAGIEPTDASCGQKPQTFVYYNHRVKPPHMA